MSRSFKLLPWPRIILILLATGACLASAAAQTPSPTPDNDVVKITSKIVQVDVLVVDKEGKLVPDLSSSDFEILQDGKAQKISGFSYVDRSGEAPAESDRKSGGSVAAPPVRITAANAGRLITFIVDDGNCSFSTTGARATREGIQKFIREQMLPTDMVAIYHTRSGSSVYQQYSNDRAHLLNIAGKIRWNPPAGLCTFNDGSIFEAARSNTYIKRSTEGVSTQTIESDAERRSRENIEDRTADNQVVGSLGVIRYVIKGLQRAPGRKVVFFLSDGLPVRSRGGEFLDAGDVLRDLVELANRSSVVFNTIDSRGIVDAGMIEARDEVYAAGDVLATDKIRDERTRAVINSQDGMAFLARESGGRFYQGENSLDHPIKKALKAETGYYLIAYDPPDEAFKGKNFNKIEVKVKRPGLRVVSRTGFIGSATESTKPKRRSENSDLYEAIVSPLPVPGLSVELTAFFAHSREQGNFVRSYFRIGGGEIKFVEDTGGHMKAVLDVVAVTMNEKSEVIDEFTRTHTIKLDAASVGQVKEKGLIYSADVPVKDAGNYNFRVAVRDASTGFVGSAGQVINVPDLRKSRIYLSGLTVTEADAQGKFVLPAPSTAASAFSLPVSTSYAVREFRPGATLAYAYTIYNARPDKTTGRPAVTIRVNLYKDGKPVLESQPQPAQFESQADWTHIRDYGYMRLKPDMEPGSYTMQVVVADTLAGGNAVSSQWVDFTVLDKP